jgi:nucleotide-binding universal stress UspA family protein
MPDGPVLICYDGSESAQRAIDVAADLLTQRDAVVLDVGAAITPAESLATFLPVAPSAAFGELNADTAAQTARVGLQQARRAGFEASARSEVGAPTWQAIVDVADELDASVIVLGTRAFHGLREAFEGSTAHDVAEHAGRPLLIAPPRNGDG